jgi:hypothetical protein
MIFPDEVGKVPVETLTAVGVTGSSAEAGPGTYKNCPGIFYGCFQLLDGSRHTLISLILLTFQNGCNIICYNDYKKYLM